MFHSLGIFGLYLLVELPDFKHISQKKEKFIKSRNGDKPSPPFGNQFRYPGILRQARLWSVSPDKAMRQPVITVIAGKELHESWIVSTVADEDRNVVLQQGTERCFPFRPKFLDIDGGVIRLSEDVPVNLGNDRTIVVSAKIFR